MQQKCRWIEAQTSNTGPAGLEREGSIAPDAYMRVTCFPAQPKVRAITQLVSDGFYTIRTGLQLHVRHVLCRTPVLVLVNQRHTLDTQAMLPINTPSSTLFLPCAVCPVPLTRPGFGRTLSSFAVCVAAWLMCWPPRARAVLCDLSTS